MSDNSKFFNPLMDITDQASADKYVGSVLDNCTDDEYDMIAKAYMGEERFAEWKRLKSMGGKDARDRAKEAKATGPAYTTGGDATDVPASKAAANAALARTSNCVSITEKEKK